MSLQDVAIPRRMRALQRDKRGYPVPYTVLRDLDNCPHFAVNNSERQARCVREKRCSICGGKIERELWLVGGPLSAFHPAGAYRDPAMHYECMAYALQVCPYLAMPSYTGRIDLAGLDPSKVPDTMAFIDSTMIPERPQLFVAVCTRRISDTAPAGQPFATVTAERPYIRAEYWQNGTRLHALTGMELVTAILQRHKLTANPAQLLKTSS